MLKIKFFDSLFQQKIIYKLFTSLSVSHTLLFLFFISPELQIPFLRIHLSGSIRSTASFRQPKNIIHKSIINSASSYFLVFLLKASYLFRLYFSLHMSFKSLKGKTSHQYLLIISERWIVKNRHILYFWFH